MGGVGYLKLEQRQRGATDADIDGIERMAGGQMASQGHAGDEQARIGQRFQLFRRTIDFGNEIDMDEAKRADLGEHAQNRRAATWRRPPGATQVVRGRVTCLCQYPPSNAECRMQNENEW